MSYNPGKTQSGKFLYDQGVRIQQAANAAARNAEKDAAVAAEKAKFERNTSELLYSRGYPQPQTFERPANYTLARAASQTNQERARVNALAKEQVAYKTGLDAYHASRMNPAAGGAPAYIPSYVPSASIPEQQQAVVGGVVGSVRRTSVSRNALAPAAAAAATPVEKKWWQFWKGGKRTKRRRTNNRKKSRRSKSRRR